MPFLRPCSHHPVRAINVALFGRLRETELLAHDAGKEAANRMLLPYRRLHDGGNGYALLTLEHCEHVIRSTPRQ
jgi:hypothetical protein